MSGKQSRKVRELELSEEEFQGIRDLIAERAGIYFEPEKRELLKANLLQRMKECGLDTFADYFNLLSNTAGAKEFDHLLDLITIPETHFFRDQAQFRALERVVIPEIVEKKSFPGATLRIWSAGCSTGEEPYTIAMILAAGMTDAKYPPIQILATDVSHAVLEAARRGVYGTRAVRDVPGEYINRFFTKRGEGYFLDDSIKEMVQFRYFNLMAEPRYFVEMSGWDIVFCRNVTIYFQSEATKKLIRNFHRSLREGGYLFAGFSESLRYLTDEFSPVQIEGAFVYKKTPPAKKQRRKSRQGKRGLSRTSTAGNARRQPPKAVDDKRSGELAQICSRAKELLERGQPEQASDLLHPYSEDSAAAEAVLLLQAEIALNQGGLKKAVRLCDRLLNRQPLSVAGHYLLGIIYRTSANETRAVEEFEKVTSLDSEHALARFNLGDLYSKMGRLEEAKLQYSSVVRLLREVPDSFDEQFAGGFSPALLIDTCLSRIKALESGSQDTRH